MKCLKARFGLAKAFVLAVAFALVCVCGLAGCSQQATSESGSGLVKSEDYPNTVTVDKLSMEYPNEFEVSKSTTPGSMRATSQTACPTPPRRFSLTRAVRS